MSVMPFFWSRTSEVIMIQAYMSRVVLCSGMGNPEKGTLIS